MLPNRGQSVYSFIINPLRVYLQELLSYIILLTIGVKRYKTLFMQLNKWQCVKSIFCGSTNRHLFETRIKSEGG